MEYFKFYFFLRNKAKVQLIPTAVFLTIYVFLFDLPLYESFVSSSKQGYWFTFSLFLYFFLYVIYRFICYACGRYNGNDVLLIIIGLLLYFVSFPQILERVGIMNTFIVDFLGVTQFKYFLFFSFGTIVKKHFNECSKMLNNKYVTAMFLCVFGGVVLVLLKKGYSSNGIWNHILLIISAILGIMIVFAFFRKYQISFTKERALGKFLQYIGKRTLEIYLLHYFILPRNLGFLGRFFVENVNPAIEFFISIAISLIVIGLCLVISNIIRISPLMGHYLFGAKMTECIDDKMNPMRNKVFNC